MNSIDRRETHKDATVAVDRRSSRNKVLKGAHVAFNNEFSAIPCTVRNVSETGARLVIEGGGSSPTHLFCMSILTVTKSNANAYGKKEANVVFALLARSE